MKTLDVIVAGELYVDLIMSGFDFWPQPGREAFAREFHREIGGGAAITACGLAKLGSAAGVLGIVGSDNGAWIVDQLRSDSVTTSDIRFDSTEPTAFTVAVTSPEDRAFLTYAGANRGFPAALKEAARDRQLTHARHIHLAYPPELDTAAELFELIHANGCTISLDVGWHEDWLADARAVALLPSVDIFFPNEAEARRMMGEDDAERCLRRFDQAGANRVPLKLGPRGSAMLCDGAVLFVEAPRVLPVDTTGAGDCFDAGFLHAFLNGSPPQSCLQTANICGALSTESHGGIAGFPARERLEQELKKYSCAK